MFGDNLNLAIDVLRDDIKRERDNMTELWRLYEELRKKVNGLYGKDIHDTERPKIDMLHDIIDNEVWDEIHTLRHKVIELEKKK